MIKYSLQTDAQVTLAVFDISGNKVAVLEDYRAWAGSHQVIWDGQNSSGQPVSSGLYFYRLSIDGDRSVTKRMLLIK
jgi:flagellar hook assembly protein FlgD